VLAALGGDVTLRSKKKKRVLKAEEFFQGMLMTAREPDELVEAVRFPLKFYASAWQFLLHRVVLPNQNAQLVATHGHVDNTDTAVLSAPCKFSPLLIENVRFDWVRALGDKFRSPQTKILFYVAPVPACGNVSSVVERPYNQLPAAPPVQVPPEFFSNDVRYLHPLPFAVPQLTRNLSDAVRPLLAAPEAQAQTSSANQDKHIPRHIP